MHVSLRPGTNADLIGFWAIASFNALLVHPPPTPVVPASVGAILGLIVGVLQSRAIGGAVERFHGAHTMTEVHRAFASTQPGKLASRLWLSGPLLILLAAALRRNPLGGAGVGMAMFFLMGELGIFTAVRRLRQSTTAVEQTLGADGRARG